jgi:hypothetical protein
MARFFSPSCRYSLILNLIEKMGVYVCLSYRVLTPPSPLPLGATKAGRKHKKSPSSPRASDLAKSY